MCESAEYKAFKDCHSSLLTCIKQSPKDVCDHLLPFEILAPDDRDYLRNDTHDAGDKARRILDAVLLQIKNDPQVFHSFVSALEAAGGFTKAGVQELKDALQRQHQQCDQSQRMEENRYENSPMSLLQPLPELAVTEEAGSVFELPTMDDGDGGTLPDPLEHPPDDTEVGADLRAAATSRQVAPTADSFGGRLLQTFQSGEIEQVIELLSQAKSQSIDLRGVSDADGKTLLHLVCRKNWVDWYHIVSSLVENHYCDVAAVDEDGNTPLHEAYQCGNLPSVEYLLSLPSCNPDAINKYEYTVLRMALEKNDKQTVAQLLATGRVDPRKGSSCGHTYSELLAMNQLQPQPQDYDGSALQMVIQFAECMEGNNHVRQPFTSYCLHKMLHKILKNRNQVTITRIVDRIKENMLPLPKEPDKIHNLIIDIQSLSDEFDIRGEPTNVVDIQIRKKEGREIFQRDIQQESINTTQNVTVPADVEDQETSDYSNAREYGKYPRASEFRNSSR
ncbi:uncharacterized protein LOC135345387 isoform X1 [Halichondria panicea]|uniref:uncharacterized protein LOC135345387 isoform X1 n=1 Tax=Halichondria panicea TaxID=6063 RepID=UPI00312B7EB1